MIRKNREVVLLITISFISQLQHFRMYFWHDDYTSLYNIQQNLLVYWPYYFPSFLTKILYPFFQLNPFPYFLLQSIFYALATIVFYVTAKKIFENEEKAFWSALIFSVGYLGWEETAMPTIAGLATLPGLVMSFLTVYFLIDFLKTRNIKSIFFSFFSFLICLEVAPYRFIGLVLITAGVDFLYTLYPKINFKNLVSYIKRQVIFVSLFVIQYLFRPTHYLLKYPYSSCGNCSPVKTFPVELDFLNQLKIFISNLWSMFFPSSLQQQLYYEILPKVIKPNLAIFVLVFGVYIVFILFLVLKKHQFKKIALFSVFSFLATVVFLSIDKDPMFVVALVSGSILLLFFSLNFVSRPVEFNRTQLTVFVIFVSSFATFLFTKLNYYAYSNHRYFLTLAPAFSMLLVNFVFNNSNSRTKILNKIFFLTIVFLHLLAGYIEQRRFVSTVGSLSRIVADTLSKNIKPTEDKILIMINAEKRQDGYVLGDTLRVGSLSSEAAVATHLKIKYEKIFVVENTDDLKGVIAKNPDIGKKNIYWFYYRDNKLINNTKDLVLD